MSTGKRLGGEDELDELEDGIDEVEPVEVERLPNAGGWEFYKATDCENERELWTAALRLEGPNALAYALFRDPAGEPVATGVLRPSRAALELEDEDRERALAAIVAEHDPAYGDYEGRIRFEFEPPSLEGEDADDAEDDLEDDLEDEGG